MAFWRGTRLGRLRSRLLGTPACEVSMLIKLVRFFFYTNACINLFSRHSRTDLLGFLTGMASLALGCGRQKGMRTRVGENEGTQLTPSLTTADDPIDPYAGIILHAKVGDFVAKGDPLITCRVGHDFKHLPYTPSSSALDSLAANSNDNGNHHGNHNNPAMLSLPSPKVRLDRGVKRVRDAVVLGDVQEHANTGLLVSYVVDDYDIYSFDQALDVKCFTRRRRQ